MKDVKNFPEYYTFDDVLLKPCYSAINPTKTSIETFLTPSISLKIPLISAPMDTVTESDLAICLALNGGIGILHKNMSIEKQKNEVKKVKRFRSTIIYSPVTIEDNVSVSHIKKMSKKHSIYSFPVISSVDHQTLVGIVTNRDIRFSSHDNLKASDIMTKNVVTAPEGTSEKKIEYLMRRNRIERIVIVNNKRYCIGLSTWVDREKKAHYPLATQDSGNRLRVGAAISTSKNDLERAFALSEAGVDVIAIDTAHGHSSMVQNQVQSLKKCLPDLPVIAGNVATYEGARFLIDAGVDAVKVGIGPGSICTTRVITGVGVPQLSCIFDVARAVRDVGSSVCLIADGGIRYSGDLTKALSAGCDSVMMGFLFSGTKESPGEIFYYRSNCYKKYRGMGSMSAMKDGSSSRYCQEEKESHSVKTVPEGVESRVPYKGSAHRVISQMTGGLRSAMGYLGVSNFAQMRKNAQFIRVSPSAVREGHIHDVTVSVESTNYPSV